MYQKLSKKTEGFTIIEVLIVLAIAGLIMLIVFLAVPALQRNSRNNARNSDASRIAAAITECLSNRNNQTASCDNNPNTELNIGTRSQLTGVPSLTSPANTTTAHYQFNAGCNPQGDAVQTPGPSASSFAVTYQLEGTPAVTRCIAS